MPKYDTSEPILILVRRGRKNRGFSVSPVEDISNVAACANEQEIGEVIKEMLDDVSQPRVNVNDLLSAAAPSQSGKSVPEAEDDRPEEDGDEDEVDEYEVDEESDGVSEGGVFDGVAESANPADQLLFNIFSSVVSKGRSMSSTRVRSEVRKKKRKNKK